MLTTGLLFEQKLRKLLLEEIEARKEELSWANNGADFPRMIGRILGLRDALEMCDEVSKDVMLTL